LVDKVKEDDANLKT
jgi:predicted RNase H-like nuclease (RuvC/YqgF family)